MIFIPALILKNLEERLIGIHDRDVGFAVAVEVPMHKGTPIQNTIRPAEAGNIKKTFSRLVQKKPVSLLAAVRKSGPRLAISRFVSDKVLEFPARPPVVGPQLGGGETWVQFLVGAHDRAPVATSQIHFTFNGGRGGKIAIRNVNVEEAVVVEITKLATP